MKRIPSYFARCDSFLARVCWTSLVAIAALVVPLTRPYTANSAEVVAYAGQPFGVGRITLNVSASGVADPLEDERFTVSSADGRVLYPVLGESPPVRKLIRRLLEIETPRNATVYFLFRGDAPFELQAYAPTTQTIPVRPVVNAAEHARLLTEWWTQYGNRWLSLQQNPRFPPVVENFLAANLSRRLGLRLPERKPGLLDMLQLAPQKRAWDDLLVTETHQLALDQSLLSGNAAAAGPLQPLPPALPWYDVDVPADQVAETAVESIALHVPVECFYIRYGNFLNYLWFRDLSRKWDGDLANMVMRRAVDHGAHTRIEEQLAIHESKMAKILGPQVIADVAMIGLDPYMPQGAAFGILFQAKASVVLTADLTSQRLEALKKYPDAKASTLTIADHQVSLIATPGGEVRSYYVYDGDYHLVTTSERLVRRFLQAGQGDRALAASPAFLNVRQKLAHDRDDAAFVYASPEFFRNLASPAVWIESQRRARSLREMKLIELARLEAAAEGVAASSVPELIAAGLLPANFAPRGDGSTLVEDATGMHDSERGWPGRFVPVADREVTGATAAEAAAYTRFADRFRQEVGQMPPIAVGIRRIPLADGSGETMAADVLATPLENVKLGRLPDMLGEPSNQRVGPIAGDLIRGEAVVEALLPLPGSDAEPHHFFFAAQDFGATLVAEQGRLKPASPLSEFAHIYWGAWPKPGLLKIFSPGNVADGPEPVPADRDAWQARREDFTLMGFQQELVRRVLPELLIEQVADPAQAWLDVADLAGTQLAGVVNALGYARSREASLAACRLMNTLANQLHVPRDQCRAVAESLVDGQFIDPLGGDYQVVEVLGGQAAWTSSALAPQNQFLLTQPPEDFQLPALTWFKGARGRLLLDDKALSAHIEIDMAKSAVP